MNTKNPWLGLASYEEPQSNTDNYLFCGRDEETLDMVCQIDNNLFVTLYGSSGIGKTSLLRAGVMPVLRRRDYFPIYIRLSQEPASLSYAEAIVGRLQDGRLKVERLTSDAHNDGNDRLYLWNYFATTRFYSGEREVYPVIILDQFEEIFRNSDKNKAELLLKQMYPLLNDELEIPSDKGYNTETNYRFVASIREDFLFVLEDSIDELALGLYKNNRYRLRPMKPEQARAVVLLPGKGCIDEGQKEAIADRIVTLSKRNERGEVDTLLLSLVCAGTYDKKSGEKIVVDDLAVWKDNPMEVYYKDAVKPLSATQMRYIQQHFIREDGSRRRVESSQVKAALGEATYLQLTAGANKLLTVGDQEQVELLHDKIGLAVYEERKAFEERERKRKFRNRAAVVGLFLLALVGLFVILNHRLQQQKWKMLENQFRFVAEKANELADDGDSYLARRLLLEVLPMDVNNPQRPYVVEAESALRNVLEHDNAILYGHTGRVESAAFSPDGKRIVSASCDNTIRIWDAETGKQIGRPVEGHTMGVESAAFSPDGKRIVSASRDKTIRIWDAETGKQIGRPLEGHTSGVYSASFSPDGKRIVSASNDSTIRIWDAKTGRQIGKPLEGHTAWGYSASFSPDGKRIVSASMDKTIRIWDAETGKQIGRPLEGHTSCGVKFAFFSPDGKRIVSASYDKTIRIWDAETGKQIGRPLEGHTSYVNSAAFSLDGKRIVSASDDSTIRIWDAETGKQIGRPFEGHTSFVNFAAFSPDGKRIVSASSDNTIRIWDAETDKQIGRPLEWHILWVYSAAFSPNGKRIVSASSNTIRIWDAETGRQIGTTLEWQTSPVNSAAFSPDGKRIVSASSDSTIRIWDAETGKQIGRPFEGHTSFVNFAAFSPDGKRIVSASVDKTIRIWDTEMGKQVGRPLEGHTSGVNSAAFSPDGRRIVSASNDRSIRIWNAKTGRQIGRPLEGHTSSVNSAAFSPDGKRIVSASWDKTIRIWDAKTGRQIGRPLKGHTSYVTSAAFSPDGKRIVSASADKTIRIWDAETGKQIGKPLVHISDVKSAAFSPDGKRIVSASSNTIRIWDYPSLQDLIDKTYKRFKNNSLTHEERSQYYLEK